MNGCRHLTERNVVSYIYIYLYIYIYPSDCIHTERNAYRFFDGAITLRFINYLRVTRSLLVKMHSRRS